MATVANPFGEVVETDDLVFTDTDRVRMNDELRHLPTIGALLASIEDSESD